MCKYKAADYKDYCFTPLTIGCGGAFLTVGIRIN